VTLVVTAVAPDAIVMGTDSAVALRLPGAPTNLVYRGLKNFSCGVQWALAFLSLARFPLILDKRRLAIGCSIGTSESWVTSLLTQMV